MFSVEDDSISSISLAVAGGVTLSQLVTFNKPVSEPYFARFIVILATFLLKERVIEPVALLEPSLIQAPSG